MSYPNRVQAPISDTVAGVESFNISWPSTQEGDILFLQVSNNGASIETPTDWTPIATGGINGFNDKAIFAIVADGTETGNITVSRSGTGVKDWTYILDHWRGAASYKISSEVTGNSTTPNPPSLTVTPDFSQGDIVWLTPIFMSNDNAPVNTYPLNYTGGVTEALGTVSATAYRELNAETEDPGTYELNFGQNWSAYTIAIEPAASGDQTISLTADQGSYSVTGQDTSLSKLYVLVAKQGSYSIIGADGEFLETVILLADSGNYSLTGQATQFLRTLKLIAEQGTYSQTGQASDFLRSLVLNAEQGSYSLTGQDAIISAIANYILTAESGNYSLTGNDVDFLKTLTLQAETGNYSLTGQQTDFLRKLILSAESGSYTITGQDVNLVLEDSPEVLILMSTIVSSLELESEI